MNNQLLFKERIYPTSYIQITSDKRNTFRLLVMRTLLFLLFLLVLQSSAKVMAQTVTLNFKNAPIESVLKEIKKQTKYDFAYNEQALKNTQVVSINVKNRPLEEVLQKVFEGQPLTYKFTDGIIVITEKQQSNKNVSLTIGPSYQNLIKGRVVDSQGNPLGNVTVQVVGSNIATQTNSDGSYELKILDRNSTISYHHLGWEPTSRKASNEFTTVTLYRQNIYLDHAVVEVNTGYQTLPKERATGSFVTIDSSILQRSVSTNILQRLDGVASSLILNKTGGYNTPDISIRGRSTILGNANPLVVVDNFPYNGDITSLNPNDVESITILKDAAAASIWGTQAGNGVIVITTKSGKFNKNIQVGLTANITIGQKPRLYTKRGMTSAEYVEVETEMFEKGRYNTKINNGYAALSPAVEILLLHRNGNIDLATRTSMLDSLSNIDIRDDLLRYFHQVPISQQYNLNLSGGTNNQKFYLSAGYDHNLLQNIGSSYERFTINGQNTYNLINDRLKLVSGMQFTSNKTEAAPSLLSGIYQYPYLKLADENGNALPFAQDLRSTYVEAQKNKGLLDWYYRPIDERAANQFNSNINFRIQNNLTYQIVNPLKISLYHSYQKGLSNDENWKYASSYYTRNLINTLSSISPATGTATSPIKEGDILQNTKSILTSQYGRMQISFDKVVRDKHTVSSIAGIEVSESRIDGSSSSLYGYNPETGSNSNSSIDFTKQYPRYYGSGTQSVETGLTNSKLVDRNISYYTNAAYSYVSKYTISASVRKDESNIFGVDANQKGVPLWSIGGLWHIYKEQFYRINWLPLLSLRTTYGYNGNVDKSTSAYFTTRLSPFVNEYGLFPHSVLNPPNPSLRWERVSNLNVGLDFASKNQKISGSIEFYLKHGQDLIGLSQVAPQTGLSVFRGNNSNIKTKGLDITLNTKNIVGNFNWQTTILANFVKDKISRYSAEAGSNGSIIGGGSTDLPLVGYPFNGIFAFKWAGLDNTGAPQGYVNGEVSKDYTLIVNSKDRNELQYMGTRSPTAFGSVLNTLNYKNVQLSFLLNYKAGHVFRVISMGNSTLYATSSPGSYANQPDYGKRWKNPGDEAITNVPALIYPANSNRDSFYRGSEILVHNADHLRLQDVRISINLSKKYLKRSPLKQLMIFAYANNLGILWRSNKQGFDPESTDIQQTKNISFGFTGNF